MSEPVIVDKTVPYEVLIRYDDDGKPKGAHIQERRIITMDGEIIKDDVGAAQPLSLDGFKTSDLLSKSLRDALIQVNILTEQLAIVTSKQETKNVSEEVAPSEEFGSTEEADQRIVPPKV